jgi:hypothetical protein
VPLRCRRRHRGEYSAINSAVGGIGALELFGALIGTKERMPLTWATSPARCCC